MRTRFCRLPPVYLGTGLVVRQGMSTAYLDGGLGYQVVLEVDGLHSIHAGVLGLLEPGCACLLMLPLLWLRMIAASVSHA